MGEVGVEPTSDSDFKSDAYTVPPLAPWGNLTPGGDVWALTTLAAGGDLGPRVSGRGPRG